MASQLVVAPSGSGSASTGPATSGAISSRSSTIGTSSTGAKSGSPGPTPSAPSTLSSGDTLLAVLFIAIAMLVAGVVVIWARSLQKPTHGTIGNSYIRAWIAISLIMGLLLFCALSFGINDSTLRSSLVGGLTASLGSAIAFYFLSNSAAQASQALLTATGATDVVPSLVGMTQAQARSALGASPFKFEIDPTGNTNPDQTATIDSTNPPPGSTAPKGSSVKAHFPPP